MSNISGISTDNLTNKPTTLLPYDIHMEPLAFIFILGGLGSIFGSFMILWAIYKSNELKKNRCYILIGNLALSDGLSSPAFIYSGILTAMESISGLNSVAMTQENCYFTHMISVASMSASNLSILAIGLDRMVALCWPIFYKNLRPHYGYVICAISWLHGLLVAGLGWPYKDPRIIVPLCLIPLSLRGPAFTFWNYINVAVNILVIIAYTSAFVRARKLRKIKSQNSENTLRQNRVLASLLTFAVIYVLGWLSTSLLVFLVTTFQAQPVIIFHSIAYSGVFTVINIGCNFFIYYARSDEYRKVFRELLGLKNNQITTINVTGGGDHGVKN